MMIFKITILLAVVYFLLYGFLKFYIISMSAIDKLRWSYKKFKPWEAWAISIAAILKITVWILVAIDVVYFVFVYLA